MTFAGARRAFCSGLDLASSIVVLAGVAALPIANLYVLGCLLAAEGRVARSGRLTAALPLVPHAGRILEAAAGLWILTLPLRLLSSAVEEARLVDPDAAPKLGAWLAILTVVAGVHGAAALVRGGRLAHFLRPIATARSIARHPRGLDAAAARLRAAFSELEVVHRFRLGLQGFVGALLWLVVPVLIFTGGTRAGPAWLLTLVGGALLGFVSLWLPFLQARFAAGAHPRAFLELREVRRLFKRAPLSWVFAASVTYALYVPLIAAKVVVPPADLVWLVTPAFVATVFVARVLVGWAYARAERGEPATPRVLRLAKVVAAPIVLAHVLTLFATPFLVASGKWGLLFNHAFLLPAPF